MRLLPIVLIVALGYGIARIGAGVYRRFGWGWSVLFWTLVTAMLAFVEPVWNHYPTCCSDGMVNPHDFRDHLSAAWRDSFLWGRSIAIAIVVFLLWLKVSKWTVPFVAWATLALAGAIQCAALYVYSEIVAFGVLSTSGPEPSLAIYWFTKIAYLPARLIQWPRLFSEDVRLVVVAFVNTLTWAIVGIAAIAGARLLMRRGHNPDVRVAA
jgi:hypothetical protein